MENELLKKLKEAGFDILETRYVEPTLEELIRACMHYHFQSLDNCHGEWCAKGGENFEFSGYGDTPKEAVANLWLSIKNK